MTPAEARLQHVSNLVVGATGVIYGWMLYFAVPADEFSVVNHPLQPTLHAWHVVTAPVLVFGVALIWKRHVWARVRGGFPHRRATGLLLFALFVPMVLSAYLLQVSVEELTRAVWRWTHVATSVLWLVAYLVHQLSSRPERERAAGGVAEGD